MASASQGQPTQIPSQQLIAQATTVPPLLVVDHASQPFPHAFRHRSVLTRRDQRSALRPLTLSQPLREQVTTEHIPGNTAQVLKRQVIQELKARLRDNGIDTGDENRFSPLLFSFLLPVSYLLSSAIFPLCYLGSPHGAMRYASFEPFIPSWSSQALMFTILAGSESRSTGLERPHEQSHFPVSGEIADHDQFVTSNTKCTVRGSDCCFLRQNVHFLP